MVHGKLMEITMKKIHFEVQIRYSFTNSSTYLMCLRRLSLSIHICAGYLYLSDWLIIEIMTVIINPTNFLSHFKILFWFISYKYYFHNFYGFYHDFKPLRDCLNIALRY